MSEVTVYSTPSCPYCVKIKEWLEQENIDYKEHNVAEDKEKAKEMVQKTGQRGVPQTIIQTEDDEKAVIGFQPEQIKEQVE